MPVGVGWGRGHCSLCFIWLPFLMGGSGDEREDRIKFTEQHGGITEVTHWERCRCWGNSESEKLELLPLPRKKAAFATCLFTESNFQIFPVQFGSQGGSFCVTDMKPRS